MKLKQQSPWSGPQPTSVAPASTQAAVMPSSASVTSVPVTSTTAVSLTCNWTEHTSPEGFKYYYNSVTRESKVGHHFSLNYYIIFSFAIKIN